MDLFNCLLFPARQLWVKANIISFKHTDWDADDNISSIECFSILTLHYVLLSVEGDLHHLMVGQHFDIFMVA